MTVSKLKKLIKDGDIPKYMIFTGDEYYIQRCYISKIAEVGGLDVVHTDDCAQTMRNSTMIGKPKLYVLWENADFTKDEKLRDKVIHSLGKNYLVYIWLSYDKRSKLYKDNSDIIYDFQIMRAEVVRNRLLNKYDISEDNADTLIRVCGGNYGRIMIEMDKISSYAEADGLTIDDACSKLIDIGTIHIQPDDAVFDLVDAVLRNNPTMSFKLLRDYMLTADSILPFLSILYGNARQLYQVQTCDSSNVAKSTGLTQWQITCARRVDGHWSSDDILYLMQSIRRVDSAIKAGRIEEKLAGKYLLVDYFR